MEANIGPAKVDLLVPASRRIAAPAPTPVAQRGKYTLFQKFLLRWRALSNHEDWLEFAIGACLEDLELLLVVLHVLLNHVLILFGSELRLLHNFLEALLRVLTLNIRINSLSFGPDAGRCQTVGVRIILLNQVHFGISLAVDYGLLELGDTCGQVFLAFVDGGVAALG